MNSTDIAENSSSQNTDPAQNTDRALKRLLAAVADGNESAFEEFYELTSRRVFGRVMCVLRDQAQSDEVTQEVYLQVWQSAERFRSDDCCVIAWLLTLAHSRAVDRVRSAQAARRRDTEYATFQKKSSAHDSDWIEAKLDVQAAMQQLTAKQRQCVALAHYVGHPRQEIADMLGAPVGTVKTRARDGLGRLRVTLNL